MLHVLDLGADDILAYRIDGTIDTADIDRAFGAVDQKLAAHQRVRVYVELHSLTGMTWQALWRDVALGLQRLDLLARVERAALVTDLEWLRRAASLEDRLFRGIQIRAFPLAEQTQAQAWIRG